MSLERRQRHGGAGSQIPQFQAGAAIVAGGGHHVEALGGVPSHGGDGGGGVGFAAELAPRFSLAEVPDHDGAIGGGGGEDVGDLGVPCHLNFFLKRVQVIRLVILQNVI